VDWLITSSNIAARMRLFPGTAAPSISGTTVAVLLERRSKLL